MTGTDLHQLAVVDLHARVRLGLWALVEKKPARLAILGEAAALAVADVQREAARRGLIAPAKKMITAACPCLMAAAETPRATGKHVRKRRGRGEAGRIPETLERMIYLG